MHDVASSRAQEILVALGKAAGCGAEFRLNEWECYQVLDATGLERCPAVFLPLAAETTARSEWAQAAMALADTEGRLLVKICGRRLLHKTELHGLEIVRSGRGSSLADLILAAADRVVAAACDAGRQDDVEGVLACGFVEHHANTPGQEVLLTLKQDSAFGPVVVVGVGGTLTEWYGRGSGGGSTIIFPARGLEASAVAEALQRHPLLSILAWPSRLYCEPPLAPERLTAAVIALARLGLETAPGEGGPTLESYTAPTDKLFGSTAG